MRIALVSATERAPDGGLRAEQALAGRSVLDWQIDLALQIGCERVICLCLTPSSDLIIGAQRRVERQGLSFHALRSHMQMANLVRSQDQVFIQLDGLIVGNEAMSGALQSDGDLQNRIFVLGADHALSTVYSQDFQRIDRERHWSGIAMLPGECALALKDMPEDGDAVSLLLRLGLQARVSCEDTPASFLENGQWILSSNAEAMEQRGRGLIASSLSPPNWTGPGAALARTVVRATADRWLGASGQISAGVAITGMLAATGLAAFGFGAAGLGLAALGAFAACLSRSAGQLRSGLAAREELPAIMRFLPALILALAAGVLILAGLGTSGWQVDVALPLIAIGLTHIAGQMGAQFGGARLRAFWDDLPTHLAILAGSAVFGFLQSALLVLSLGAVLQLMLRSYRN